MSSAICKIEPARDVRAGSRRGQMAEDEAALVERAGAGDAAAFRVLVTRHLGVVVSIAQRFLRDRAEAEDVAQETMLRLWRLGEGIDVGVHGVRPWLRRVATNLAIDRLRASGRLDITDEVPDQYVPPSQYQGLREQEVAERMAEALSALPDRQRVALVLFHYEEMSQREVAAEMGVSEDALESLLARARRGLKAMLQDEWRELLPDES